MFTFLKNQVNRLNLPKTSTEFLVLLLCADLFFILLHIVHKIARILDIGTLIRTDVFSIYYDLTLAESFQYVKEYWIVILFAWLIFKHKQSFYIGWMLVFIYFLFDDMLGFHEGWGTALLEALNIPPFEVLFGEFRYQDIGEFAVSAFFGIIFFTIIGFSYFRSGKEVRAKFHYLIAGLFIIVFFGVAHDLGNRIFEEEADKLMFEITRLIEDGGEMIGMTLVCWYVTTLTDLFRKPADT